MIYVNTEPAMKTVTNQMMRFAKIAKPRPDDIQMKCGFQKQQCTHIFTI